MTFVARVPLREGDLFKFFLIKDRTYIDVYGIYGRGRSSGVNSLNSNSQAALPNESHMKSNLRHNLNPPGFYTQPSVSKQPAYFRGTTKIIVL